MEQLHKQKTVGYWNICGDFGELAGEVMQSGNDVCYKGEIFTVTSHTEEFENGVFVRKDIFENTSDKPVKIQHIQSAFAYDNSEFEVYTQYNLWQHEAKGAWSLLNTSVTAAVDSVRTTCGANPFIVLWDNQVGRGMAYHLLPESSWSMTVSRKHANLENMYVTVEMGLNARNFEITLQPHEKLELPEIIYYEVTDKVGLDGWKLHSYWLKKYPRRDLPVMYNTWLARFDKLNFDEIAKQIELAADIGAEYFVTDAGWFGHGDATWSESIGDWDENQNGGYCGRMQEVADLVRKHNMKFGLWFEPERALLTSDSYRDHPEFYIKSEEPYLGTQCFLDFANPDALEYIYNLVSNQIKRCKIEFVKFDFNSDMFYDSKRDAFMEYFKGYNEFISRLKTEFPDLYLQNCASGGERVTLPNCKTFDSYWYTDNQNIYESMRIIKDYVRCVPAQYFDRWVTVCTATNVTPDGQEKLISIGDAQWKHVVGVNKSYLHSFMTGSPIGLSCDLLKISDTVYAELKEHIAQFKKDREFWKGAVCRVLCDTPSLFVLQYTNGKKNVIQAFTNRHTQVGIRVYPALEKDAVYTLPDGRTENGKTISEKGVLIPIDDLYVAPSITLESK